MAVTAAAGVAATVHLLQCILCRWMSAMLRRRGFKQWHQHKGAIRSITRNAFPAIRESPRVAQVSDIVELLTAHFELERTWAGHRLSLQEHSVEVGSMYK